MKIISGAIAGCGGAALIVALAVPAHAAGSESGYKSCAGVGGNAVTTRGYASGSQTHVHNSEKVVFASTGTNKRARIVNLAYRTANWQVSTTGVLDGPGTYAYCPE